MSHDSSAGAALGGPAGAARPAHAKPALALHGGPAAVPDAERAQDARLFHWPIVTEEDEQAVLDVLRAGAMSGTGVTRQFEREFADWQGTKHALAYPNGTMALLSAMWAVGIGRGDEIICPSITYWASALPVFSLGGTVVFADIEPDSLCIDPDDIERHIGPRTKALVVVHAYGHPADMDRIMPIARRHNLAVIEDVSHAQGGLYKGRMCGTFGDIAAMSMMAGKSLSVGEGGMLVTDSDALHERAVAFSQYERAMSTVTDPALKRLSAPDGYSSGLPLGGVKGRMNQTCAAMGRVQLKHYAARIAMIQSAINRFWDLLADVPGLRAHRPAADSGSTMAGWYAPKGHYVPEELGGLSRARFSEAVTAECGKQAGGPNFPLHVHPMLNEADIYGDGEPTRLAGAERDVRQPRGSLPHAEAADDRVLSIPYFKQDDPDAIARYAAAFRKVAEQADRLL